MSTLLITGGTGYIGSWVVKELLEKGHTIRLTARDKSKTEKFEHLQAIANTENGSLEIWEADLLMDGAFDEAAKGAEAIIHIASPFILKVKDAQKELIDPAVNGTKNVLNAASKSGTVKKVVLTSSLASVLGDSKDMGEQGVEILNESHWNTTSSLNHNPYSFSKVEAEKTAWKMGEEQNQWKLVVINPGFVLGPSLTGYSSSESIKVVTDMLNGKFKSGAAELYFGMVDVRDVAHAHVLALESESAEGRHVSCNEIMDFLDIAKSIEKSFPSTYKLPKKYAPKTVLLLMGWAFGVTWKFVKNNVGYRINFDNSKVKSSLKLEFRNMDETIKDMVLQMKK
jgi:nucleoside-diphosphate-sugar epimerase